jgi:DNA-binding TFAR19-related protein (PDSD5 family)
LEDDAELRMINARKMAQLKRRVELASAPKPKEKTNREIVAQNLFDRGEEVLETAYSFYPKETAVLVDYLARYLKEHKETEKISGGELLQIFRSLGLRFSLKTSIKVQERGKFVDLKDKFKFNREEEQVGG